MIICVYLNLSPNPSPIREGVNIFHENQKLIYYFLSVKHILFNGFVNCRDVTCNVSTTLAPITYQHLPKTCEKSSLE
ncbi:hypothetical protein NIES4071_95760 [Calothrix sp. NIES-4071]|nr:hypothetical protein NIES4071_95760 [Calothrix sp. NIES-4071]BAZ63841.1 hypothetical protein NIES4105_95690 [Calothrix sp. NIES-4105]